MSKLEKYLEKKSALKQLQDELQKLEENQDLKKEMAFIEKLEKAIADSGLEEKQCIEIILSKFGKTEKKTVKKPTSKPSEKVTVVLDGKEFQISAGNRGRLNDDVKAFMEKNGIESKAELIEKYKK